MFVFLTRSSAISEHTCKDFTCGSNGFCIHPDLLCDGINHCSDNSDESVHNLCQSKYIYIHYIPIYLYTYIHMCMYVHPSCHTNNFPLTEYRVLAAFRNLFMYPFCQWCMWQRRRRKEVVTVRVWVCVTRPGSRQGGAKGKCRQKEIIVVAIGVITVFGSRRRMVIASNSVCNSHSNDLSKCVL